MRFRATLSLAALVLSLGLAGCNAIFGLEQGEPLPNQGEAGAQTGGTGGGGESTGGTNGASAGAGASTTGGKGGDSGGVAGAGGSAQGGAPSGGTDTGGNGASGGSAGNAGVPGTGGNPGDPVVHYDFETAGDEEGFEEAVDCSTMTIAQSTEQHAGATGSGSLEITITGPAMGCDNLTVRRDAPDVSPGDTVWFYMHFPPESAGEIAWLDFVVEDTDYVWTLRSVTVPSDRAGWLLTSYAIPTSIEGPIRGIGFDIGVYPGFNGSFYVDEFAW